MGRAGRFCAFATRSPASSFPVFPPGRCVCVRGSRTKTPGRTRRGREGRRASEKIAFPGSTMADRSLESLSLPLEVRARLAELELELSEGKAKPARGWRGEPSAAGPRGVPWSLLGAHGTAPAPAPQIRGGLAGEGAPIFRWGISGSSRAREAAGRLEGARLGCA